MRKILKVIFDGGDYGSKNANEAVVGSAFCGSLESGGRFCVGAFGRNLVSVAVKMFSHLIYVL
jgi:hypothetical protein